MQGLINLASETKHKANLGAPHNLPKLNGVVRRKKRDSTNAIEKTYNTFLVLSVTFYIYKYTRTSHKGHLQIKDTSI